MASGIGGKRRNLNWAAKAKLTEAFQEGQLAKAKEVINSLGLNTPKTWIYDLAYGFLCDALKRKHAAIAKLILTNGTNVNNTTPDPWCSKSPLHCAVESGIEIEVVQMILDQGANIDAKDDLGRTPLYVAVRDKRLEHAKLLLEHRADVEARHNHGAYLLHVAVDNQGISFIQLLLHYGAYIDCRYKVKGEFTPLHFAVERSDKEIVKLLLSKGAEVNLQDSFGKTALHIACHKRNSDGVIVAMLLEYGANINMKCNRNQTPLAYACVDVIGGTRVVRTTLNAATKAILSYIAQMITAKLDVSTFNVCLIRINDDQQTQMVQCMKEIKIMNYETINNTNISYYEILVKHTRMLAKFMRNKTIAKALTSGEYKKKFPVYSKLMETRVRMALERKELLERGTMIFHVLNSKLPLICTDKIFSYMSINDLRIFCHAGRTYWLCESALPTYAIRLSA